MPGVQSYVAQRQQAYQRLSRGVIGAQYRVPVPTTKLENAKEQSSFPRRSPVQPAGPPLAEQSVGLSSEHFARESNVQGGFETDTEGFEDTATISIGGSRWGHQVKGDGPDHNYSDRGADDANDSTSGVQSSSQGGQELLNHVQGSRQLDPEDNADEGSGTQGSEGSYGESSHVEEDDEPDVERLVRDGIMRDLNSPGFSQYLRENTPNTTEVTFQGTIATPVVHSSLITREFTRNFQKPASLCTLMGNNVESRAADDPVELEQASRQAHERITKQIARVPAQKVRGTSTQQCSISFQHRDLPNYKAGQLPSVTSRETIWPTDMAQDIVATYTQPQPIGGRPLSIQKESVGRGDDKVSAEWASNVDRRHIRKAEASIDSLKVRKRARDLDYRLDQLSSMTFQQLSSESFNVPSQTARTSIPQELSNSDPLVAKMAYILEELKDDHAKVEQRRAFFTLLSIEQYNECANLIIDRFGAIMSRFMDARQQRRRAAKDFEEEVAKREEWVGGKLMLVDRNIGRLKRGGEEVVKGSVLS